MRPVLFAAPLLLAVGPLTAGAQSGPYFATVTADGVTLRAGPSDAMPETGRLSRGAEVVVEREENDWLAVRPPRATAVSWITAQFVEGYDPDRPLPQNVVVHATADVTLAAGVVGQPHPLEIRRIPVPQGTVLKAIGQPVKHDGKTWLPVEPPAGDFRYVRKGTVLAGGPAANTVSVRSTDTATPNPPATPAGGTAPPAPPGPVVAIGNSGSSSTVNHPLWVKAVQAESDGRIEDAEKFYYDLAREMNEPGKDHDLANLCFTRIHMLREKRRQQPGRAAAPASTVAAVPAATRDVFPPPAQTDRGLPSPSRDDPKPAVRPARDDRPAATPPSDSDDQPRWTGPGRLVRSALALDGRQTYALEGAPGIVRLYVVSDGAVDLTQYANKRVDLLGPVRTRRDLSKPFVVATKVEVNP